MDVYKFNLNNKYSVLTPSIEAFYIHKLIVSQRKDRKEEKKIKDIEQVKYLSKYVSPIKLINILNNYKLNPTLRDTINKAIDKLENSDDRKNDGGMSTNPTDFNI